MNLIFPSHPFHSNVTARNRPIVAAFTNAFHAISTQVHFARASPNPREVPLPSPLTLSVSGNGPQCIRISRYGMRKYLGSTNGVGTRTAAVHATKPMIQYTPCLLPTQKLDHRPFKQEATYRFSTAMPIHTPGTPASTRTARRRVV